MERNLLLEIHQMLCKVCSYIDKVESREYIESQDKKAFDINVAADLYVDKLSKMRGNV